MSLSNLFNKKKFKLLDVVTGKQFGYQDLFTGSWENDEPRSLIFAYVDNSFQSVSFVIEALCSKHIITLLSNDLGIERKRGLEELYQPKYIYDKKRSIISNYNIFATHIFKSQKAVEIEIDNNIKVLLSTSGTTGSPKLVKLSEKNILSNAKSIASYLPISKNDVVPLNLPINYSYGLSVLTSNCSKGNILVCGLPDMFSKEFWVYFSSLKFTTFAGVPITYEMLKRVGFLEKRYPSLRYFTQAGGSLRVSLAEQYANYANEQGCKFFVMYGQTEATARMSYVPTENLADNIGSIGKPIPGGNFSIDDKNSELLYSGDNVFGGYAEKKEDLNVFNTTTTLRTGDLGYINSNGFYVILGRLKRIIKLYGSRINLDELQTLVSERYDSQIICFGFDDRKIVLVHTTRLDVIDVKKWMNIEFGINRVSVDVIHLEEIPLTHNGKVNYTELTELYKSQ